MLKKLTNSLLKYSQNDRLSKHLAFALGASALVLGVITIFLLVSGGSNEERTYRILPLIYLDLILMLLLAVVISKRLVELWVERRQERAGSRLHIQIVVLFSVVSIIPAIIVAGFSAVFFNVAVQAWFSEPVREALNEATVVAEAYLKDHKKAIRQDAIAIVQQLREEVLALINDPKLFSHRLTQLAESRGLTEALVFVKIDGGAQPIARAYITFALEFEFIAPEKFDNAQADNVVIMNSASGDRVRVLIKLDNQTNTYLYVGKNLDKTVLSHVERTKGAITEYKQLDSQRHHLQLTFLAFFGIVTFLLMLAAIWVGLTIANFLVRPIGRLIAAAEEVSQGNLDVQVTLDSSPGNELTNLAQAFNRMTIQLQSQRQELIAANTQIDQRRQFMEAVLSRISAGVIHLNADKQLSLANQRASALLSTPLMDHPHDLISTLVPEFSELIQQVDQQPEELHNQQIPIVRRGTTFILQVSIVAELEAGGILGYIITFDDITALVSAQRKAAWSDVARRIAHEVKNPLTPIQLSAERLKRRYLKEITSDPATFQACIDTIVRQVGQIGRLINEFSSFARMPDPITRMEDLGELCRQALFLQRQAHTVISFVADLPDHPILFNCDAEQIGQMLTNLLQNAVNALEAYYHIENRMDLERSDAKIILTLTPQERYVILTVEDNGPGFPVEGRERLTEPYFTTRSKGTGLGLAIVSKIVEDHRGKLELGDSSLSEGAPHGAKVTIIFPLYSS